jgi:radical SAM superfamily enzyme YgiQ (UPF0313 family)
MPGHQVVQDAAKKELRDTYRCEHPEHHELPFLDLTVVRKYLYKISNATETVRGCPFGCNFCSASQYNGKKYRYKPVQTIVCEVEAWKRRSRLSFFADLNIVSDFDKAKEVLSALQPYKLSWLGNASINVVDDEELLKLLKLSGCSVLGIGMESISSQSLTEMNKKHNIKYDFKEVVRRLHEYNIDVFGNFIFGLDTDTLDTFEKTAAFAVEADIDFPIFQIMVPYPGTDIFKRFKQEGRLLTQDWSRYTRSDVVFQPKNMTPSQLLNGLFKAYKIAYSRKALIGRLVSRWRGIRRIIEDVRILVHFGIQKRSIMRHHGIRDYHS